MEHERLPGATWRCPEWARRGAWRDLAAGAKPPAVPGEGPNACPWRPGAGIRSALVALLLGAGLQVNAQPVAFEDCPPTMFISQGGETGNTPIHTINTNTNPFTFEQFIPGAGLFRHNALGYNPRDSFLYAIEVNDGGNERLLKFGSNQTGIRVGTISGLPSGNYNSGTFGDDGTYYVRQANSNSQFHLVNVNASPGPSHMRTITMSRSINSADMAYFNGRLYTIETGTHQLYAIDAASGAVTAIGSPKGSGLVAFGAMFVAENGLFASINTGGFYQVDTTTGALTLISASPASNNNDGAKCQKGLITFGADLSVTKTNTPEDGDEDQPDDLFVPGEERTYTIVASNSGPFGAADVTVRDPLPDGITEASWTCSGTNGGVCTASGTGAIDDTEVGLPVDATVTYLLTLTVPLDFRGLLRNTVTVTPGPTTVDDNMDNNTATDEDESVPVADLWVTKANAYDALQTGAQTTYDVVFGNRGPDDVENALLFDNPESGLEDCHLPSPACEVVGGTATCPAVGEGPGQLSMSNLASASVAVPLMQAGSSIRVRITCTVQ